MTSTSLEYSAVDAKPTRIRFGVLAFLWTLALLLYVDRVCIGQAESSIRATLHLEKWHIGWAFTVFNLAYALFEVPAGHWGDRYGSRGVVTRVVICWSIFTALTGAVTGFYSLLLVRFLFGAGEAGAWPNAARIIPRWFPELVRGRIRGTLTSMSLVGAAVAPILAAQLIHAVGWRWTFAVFGVAGVVWAVAFYAWYRDDPATHPQVNDAERALIGTPTEPRTLHADRIPWGTVLTSPNVWLLGIIMSACSALFYMLFQWYPTYLKEARGQGEINSGWLTTLVMTGGVAGCLLGGWVADAAVRIIPDRKLARRVSGATALAISGALVFAVRFMDSSPVGATLLSAAALLFMQITVPIWWSVVAEISGPHGGAMWGLMNSMASLAVMALNLAVGSLVDRREAVGIDPLHAWAPVFDGVAWGLIVGAACWCAVNATRSIVDRRMG
jgi:sugar phosphate permease